MSLKTAAIRLPLHGALVALCALGAASGPLRSARAQAQPSPKPPAQPVQTVQLGDTIVKSQTIDYDLGKRQYILTGNVDLTSRNSHMTADEMTVQMTEKNELEWAKGVGKVFVEKKNPEDGTFMKGWAKTLDYHEIQQKANLNGDAVVHQSSPRLAKPAVITGARIDMDLKEQVNIVHRKPGEQAKVHLEPKGPDAPAQPTAATASQPETPAPAAKPEQEPVDLMADRIQMNGATQEYVATGSPVVVRPSSKLRAKVIRFQIDPKTNELKQAFAEENVVYDGRSTNGSVVHSTGDNGTYNQEADEVVMEGHAYATVKDPNKEKPTVYKGHKFVFNNKTGRRSLSAGPTAERAEISIPDEPKKPAPAKEGEAKPAAPAGAEKK